MLTQKYLKMTTLGLQDVNLLLSQGPGLDTLFFLSEQNTDSGTLDLCLCCETDNGDGLRRYWLFFTQRSRHCRV